MMVVELKRFLDGVPDEYSVTLLVYDRGDQHYPKAVSITINTVLQEVSLGEASPE